jgi:hypothetical protein
VSKALVVSLINFNNYVGGYMSADDVRKTAFWARLPERADSGETCYEGTAKQKYDANYDRIFGAK